MPNKKTTVKGTQRPNGQNKVEKVMKGINNGLTTVDKAARTAIGVARTIKIIKGMFNNPKWYDYKGVKPGLSVNPGRPFDPVSLKPAMREDFIPLPGSGVTHYIINNIVFQDYYDNEAFDLDIVEAFQRVRTTLRSNLPYKLKDFKNYVYCATNAYAIYKSIEKTLGWYSATRNDMPELNTALKSVPTSTVETGRVKVTEKSMTSDERYAAAINTMEKLQTIIAMLPIPQNMKEYIDWWIGGTFIDQKAPNPQIYSNELRYIPIYSVEDGNTSNLLQIGSYDVATGMPDDCYEQVVAILRNFSVIIADIDKAELMRKPSIGNIQNYQISAMDDPEFFNVMINFYGEQKGDSNIVAGVIAPEYLRMDIYPGLSLENSVGMLHGATYRFDIPVPFAITSQAAYFSMDKDFTVPNNCSGNVKAQTGNLEIAMNTLISDTEGVYIQFTGILFQDDYVVRNEANANTFIYLTADSKMSEGGLGTTNMPTKIILSELGLRRTAKFVAQARRPNVWTLARYLSDEGEWKRIKMWLSDSGPIFRYGCSDDDRPAGNGEIFNMTLTNIETTTGVDADGHAIITMKYSTSSRLEYTITSFATDAAAHALIKAFTVGSDIMQPLFMGRCKIEFISQDISYDYVMTANNLIALFCEQVDYHIPVIVRKSLKITDTSATDPEATMSLKWQSTTMLLKECYVPVIISKENTKTVVYQMLLGLFSVA